jgi:hypothetical protein
VAARDFSVKFGFDELNGLAESLGKISDDSLAQAAVESLNVIVDNTYELARDRMLKDINLSESYVKRKMFVTPASRQKLEASITAPTSSNSRDVNNTPLGRYDAKPVTVPATSKRVKQGPGRMGIPLGSKQRGVTVRVLKSQVNTDFVPRGFLLPLRRGTEAGGNGLGVFARDRSGRLRHRYGPSPYQLFAFQADRLTGEVGDALGDDLADRVNEVLRKAIG